ncbi:hypothetical protein [uncultured Roseibium sp.]|uniref:hypothetical protein n=1 Tax=uncultured Roseibium sp. TaxID=1936171 RepID=UPI00262A0F81|nr:hypothetical protein [uncultured Roseibium sp.]
MLSLTLLSACGTVDGRLKAAAEQVGRLDAEKTLPNYPADCRKEERSGARIGEPLDVALLRSDRALGRANARVLRCAGWYDEINTGFAKEES